FCIRTLLSKAFSLREAKGCCITFFSYMRVVRILGPPMLFKIQFVDILSGDYVCRKPRKISQNLSPHPLWNRNSSRVLAFLCVSYVVKLERTRLHLFI
ncbi:hypothetical protein BRARA_B00813, partial [Brassica rapa]